MKIFMLPRTHLMILLHNSPNLTVKSRMLMLIVKIKHHAWLYQPVKSEPLLVNHVLILLTTTWILTQQEILKIMPYPDIILSSQNQIFHQNQQSVEMISWEVHLPSSKIASMDLRTLIATGAITKWALVWPQISIHQLVMKLSSGLVMNIFSTFRRVKMLLLSIWDVLMANQHSSNMATSKLVMNDL